MSLAGNLRISTSLINSLTGVDMSTPSETISESATKSISSGVLYHDTATIATSGTLSLNVGDDSLVDVFGNTINITTVTGVYIKASASNTVDVTITTTTNSMFNTLPPLSPGEAIAFLLDIDTTTDAILYLVNGAAESNVDIIITGTEV